MRRVFIFILFISLFGCSKNKNDVVINEGDVEVDVVLPQKAYFNSVRKQMADTDWGNYIYSEGISKFNDETGGYQIGILLTNCAFASAVKNEDMVKKITDQIIEFSGKLKITDEKIVYEVIDMANSFDALINDENYKEISNRIQQIEYKLKKYYFESDDKEIVEQIKFGTWIEAYYIVSKAIRDEYSSGLTNLFNRNQEINYFIETYSKYPEDYSGEINSLNAIRNFSNSKDGITKEKIEGIILEIEKLRKSYLS